MPTTEFTVRFLIELWHDSDDEDGEWYGTLLSVEPKGTGLKNHQQKCPRCSAERVDVAVSEHLESSRAILFPPDTDTSDRICNACDIEYWISDVGVVEWLWNTDPPHVFDPNYDPRMIRIRKRGKEILRIDRAGIVVVRGHLVWPCRDEDDLTFKVTDSRYESEVRKKEGSLSIKKGE